MAYVDAYSFHSWFSSFFRWTQVSAWYWRLWRQNHFSCPLTYTWKTGILSCHWLPCEAWRWGLSPGVYNPNLGTGTIPWARNWVAPEDRFHPGTLAFKFYFMLSGNMMIFGADEPSPTVRAFEQVNLGWASESALLTSSQLNTLWEPFPKYFN